ncbi:MAG TPA: hypothetical protein VIU62_10935 [Chloroflexota bacterium]
MASGRARCPGCDVELRVTTAYASRVLCPACREQRGQHFPTAERVEVRCRGYTLFGEEPRHAPSCAQTYRYTHAYLQEINSYHEGDHTFISHPCSCAKVAVKGVRGQAKKAGMKPGRIRTSKERKDLLQVLEKRRRRYNRNWAAAQGRPGVEPTALIEARRAGRGGSGGERVSWRNMAAAWTRQPKQEANVCRLPSCNKLLLYPTSPGQPPAQFHGPCYQAARRTEAGREWWRDRFKKQKEERTTPEQLPVPLRRGRGHSAVKLTQHFGWTVRFYLGGQVAAELAAEAGVSPSAVTQGIKEILALLPSPDLVRPQFRRYIEALQAAVARRADDPKSADGISVNAAVNPSVNASGRQDGDDSGMLRTTARSTPGMGLTAAIGPP